MKNLEIIDYIIIIVFCFLYLIINFILSKKTKTISNFFIGGRQLTWFIAGTSMVATTFSADTPLAVTELVAEGGISANWLWWSMIFGGMMVVYFFAKMWRRSEVLTDCEFITLRYEGKIATFLRSFRALYIGVLMNSFVIAWVNLAMLKIIRVILNNKLISHNISFLPFSIGSDYLVLIILLLFVVLYSSLAGLQGTSITDVIQFFVAMIGCIILAFFSLQLPEIGGINGLKQKLPEEIFNFFPNFNNINLSNITQISLTTFITYLFIQWWASWYPGAEPGGGGYIAQRLFSTKNEKHAIFSALWFQIAHYTIRPWPWIIVALCSLIIFPNLTYQNKGDGFILMINYALPIGFKGLLISAFIAAYFSTIASQLLLGSSYTVNDVIKLIFKKKSNKFYLFFSRISILIIMIISFIITTQINRISNVWKFILECSAGLGPWLILRWFWWRVNPYSEITAMIIPFFILPFLKKFNINFPHSLLLILFISFTTSLIITLLTKPVSEKKLKDFYNKVKPLNIGWRKITQNNNNDTKNFLYLLSFWLLSSLMIILFLFIIGSLIFQFFKYLVLYIIAFVICFSIFIILLNKKTNLIYE